MKHPWTIGTTPMIGPLRNGAAAWAPFARFRSRDVLLSLRLLP